MSRIVLHSQTIAGILSLLALTVTAGVAEANVLNSCTTYCHGLPPRDGVRKANPHFDSQSSAFSGNHRSHLPAAPSAASCNICHAPVSPTDFGHQNGVINMANSLKGYSSASIRAKYDRGLFFNQTSIPNLATATCSNVSCHFEAKSPAWNSAPLVYPTGCSGCHGAPPSGGATGASGSHARHDAYFSGATGCQKCHPGYTTFSHASSAGRPLRVQGYLRDPANNLEAAGTYSGSGINYFPSQSTSQVFGTCNTVYCHSSGQGATGTGALIYQSVAWGGASLDCGSCHQNMATASASTGSHQLHATATTSANGTGANYTCQVCHGLSYSRSKTPVGLGGSHVNNNIELSFTTISGANAAGTAYSKSASFAPGSVYGQCSTSACHGSGKPIWGANTTRPECFKCHGSTAAAFTTVSAASVAPGFNGEGRDTGGNTVATAPRVGAHQTHLTGADSISSPIHCGECHTTHLTVKDATHLNFTTATITFGPLAKTGGKAPSVVRSAGVISCSGTYCHAGKWNSGSSMTPAWVNTGYIPPTISIAGCGTCHGFPPATGTGHPAATAPAGFPVGSNCSCHANLSATGTTYANIFVDRAKHINGSIEATGGHAFPYPGATHSVATGATNPAANCSCHDYTNTGTYPVASGTAPNCKSCHTLGLLRTVSNSSCWDCHGASATDGRPNGNVFQNISGSHTKHVVGQGMACSRCHFTYGSGSASHGSSNRVAHNNITFVGLSSATREFKATKTATSATCANIACHVSATWGGKLGCVDCHSQSYVRTKGAIGATLSAVTAEFGLAYGHKKTGRGAVTDADCIVCHLEGDSTTKKTSATYHQNGTIDLRDPDGTGEARITDIGGASWSFTRFSTSFAAGTRTSTGHTSNTIANIITQKFCLKCHDSNGANNPAARVTGGTAWMPWGGSTGYTAQTATNLNGVPVANGLVNVFSQFSTGNSSLHPVRGPRTKDFPTQARMVAPYNGFTRTGTAGATAAGIVINCFDCHNNYPTLNYLGKTGLLTLRTNAAHGTSGVAASGGMIRGTFYVAAPTLCGNCHSGYTVTGQHGAGSAMASNTGRTDEGFNGQCSNCHGSKTSAPATAPARPIPAADYHGYNNRLTGTLWPTINARPVAFIRGWSGTAYHRGRALAGTSGYAAGTAQCGGGTCPNGGSVGDGSNRNYTPGGTY